MSNILKKNSCTVLIPVFNETDSLVELVERIIRVFEKNLKDYDIKIQFVNDGSTDDTELIIAQLEKKYSFISSINFRINVGKSLALMAGFKNHKTKYVITIDGDLQDNPEDIPLILNELELGYDLVNGWRENRKDTVVRKLGSKIYNKTLQWISGCKLHDMNCGFKGYSTVLTNNILIYGQYHRFIPVIAKNMGFKISEVKVKNSERKYGNSKYKAFRYEGFFDLMSLLFVKNYGQNPLHFFGIVGILIFLPNFIIIFWFVISQLAYQFGFGQEYIVAIRPLLVYSIGFMLVGLFLFLTGFVCDFILHHIARNRIPELISSCIKTKDENIKI
jgi:glycosyltransferase involved in cell wall biosynthesis